MITSFFKPTKSKRSSLQGNGKTNGSPMINSVRASKLHGAKKHPRSESPSSEKDESSPAPKQAKVTAGHKLTPPNQSSKLVDDFLTNLTEKSWQDALISHMMAPSFASLARFVALERTNKTIYAPQCDTFSALNLVPLQKVKVVIVGQDPYHQPNQGHGLAFSVRKGQRIPPSLRNIYKELMNDSDVPNFQEKPTHGYLERWAQQGVLMLNAVLTVRKNEPNSHAKKGWERFTDEIIRALLSFHNRDDGDRGQCGKGGVVFLLWGKPASKKAESVINQVTGPFSGQRARSNKPHVVICTSHPSPLGATKTSAPFLSSRCFSRANEALVEMGLTPIDWCVDDPDGGIDISDV